MTSSPTDAQTDAFDSPWKDILDGWFADFMAFFFPDAASEIDWSQGPLCQAGCRVLRVPNNIV